MGEERKLIEEARKDEALRRIVSDHDGCERARAAVDGPRNYEAERLAEIAREALAAVPVKTQEAAALDDYMRPGWRMFPLF